MIDETNLNILKILQEKGRIPNVDVARQVGLAPSAVLERIRKLEKHKIIGGYEVRLNPKFFARGLVAFSGGESPGADAASQALGHLHGECHRLFCPGLNRGPGQSLRA